MRIFLNFSPLHYCPNLFPAGTVSTCKFNFVRVWGRGTVKISCINVAYWWVVFSCNGSMLLENRLLSEGLSSEEGQNYLAKVYVEPGHCIFQWLQGEAEEPFLPFSLTELGVIKVMGVLGSKGTGQEQDKTRMNTDLLNLALLLCNWGMSFPV